MILKKMLLLIHKISSCTDMKYDLCNTVPKTRTDRMWTRIIIAQTPHAVCSDKRSMETEKRDIVCVLYWVKKNYRLSFMISFCQMKRSLIKERINFSELYCISL